MAGYWPSFSFACSWTSTPYRSINTIRKELDQYPAILITRLVSNNLNSMKSEFNKNGPCNVKTRHPNDSHVNYDGTCKKLTIFWGLSRPFFITLWWRNRVKYRAINSQFVLIGPVRKYLTTAQCTCVVNRCKYISLPSSAKQQREIIKFCVVWWTRTVTANYSSVSTLELRAGCYWIFSPSKFLEPFWRTEQIQTVAIFAGKM